MFVVIVVVVFVLFSLEVLCCDADIVKHILHSTTVYVHHLLSIISLGGRRGESEWLSVEVLTRAWRDVRVWLVISLSTLPAPTA